MIRYMSSSSIYILISVVCIKCLSLGNEISDNEMVDINEFYSYLKFTQDFNLFSSTKVYADLKQYTSGLENEDIHLNVSQLIRKYGHDVEEHNVKTKDDYILTLVRIPRKGRVVFLMHGLLMSADDWVTAGSDTGIAYLLANEGFDVWMGNARGNKHSRRHETLAPSTPGFWNFSWDEIGRYDIPAMIDHVLMASNQTKLLYVGHSQGATAFYVMCSELPEYNEKVSLMIGLAAPTAIPNMKSPFLNFMKYVTFHQPEKMFSLMREIGLHEFLPSSNLLQSFGSNICGTAELARIVCSNMVFMICGFNAAQQNITNLPVIFSHTPAGAATKQIEHYSQTVTSGVFRRFDYGEVKNLEMYGRKVPPEYDIEKISAPIALFYSDNDWLVTFKDIDVLRQRLPNIVDFYKISLRDFNHVDYLFVKDLKELVFIKLLSLLKQY